MSIQSFLRSLFNPKISHRYLIETGDAEYPCDNYTIYLSKGAAICIRKEDKYIDVFVIYCPIVAIHDFDSGLSLDEFKEKQAIDVANDIAQQPATVMQEEDVSCQ